jgi:hypothetical protein
MRIHVNLVTLSNQAFGQFHRIRIVTGLVTLAIECLGFLDLFCKQSVKLRLKLFRGDLVGDDNLRFGYGSNDSNMVYVRNPRIEMDMEIVRSQGTYTKEVLGFDDEAELKHSGRRRRFRESDE